MRISYCMLALCLLFSGMTTFPSSAQEYTQIGGYAAFIGPEDMYNSRGVRLTSLGDVLQQDRANFHRFGLRHPGDEGDPVFFDRGARSAIPTLYLQGGRIPELEAMVRRGQPFRAYMFICGYGYQPTRLIVVPEWYGDHSGCY
ncbi:hypothetical protein FMN50_16890 [Rhodobacterales bacterium]|nr:hypothetical protein FMN50_16890 [Rhodobacterales bacterium]